MEAADAERQEAFDQGTVVAQIFSGIFFSGVAAWLTLSNGTKLAFVQRASLEKRLTVCCFLNTYVGFFSAFFNFFQLTAVDNAVLPQTTTFTMDLARPVEWIMTCPLMQLVLVLMGGAKIPEYRRYLMPMFSVTILVLGTVAAFQEELWSKILVFVVACLVFCSMCAFNRQQIIEYSCGEEGVLVGDSEFRKATLLLLATWAPFPLWYVVSPEGFGFINNVLIIQIGWAFLNIVAKFIFIFYLQRVKDLYCNRLKTKRELQGNKTPIQRVHGSTSPTHGQDVEFAGALALDYDAALAFEQVEIDRKKAQLGAVVVETMSFLGMAQHTDRFLKLLDRAQVHSVSQVEVLTKDSCEAMQLPFDLVSALQRRLRVWKLEMVDEAEIGLDRGEEHYIKKAMEMQSLDGGTMMPGMVPPVDFFERQLSQEAVEEVLQKADTRFQEHSRSALEANNRKIAKEVSSFLHSVEGRLTQQFQAAVEGRLMPRIEATARTTDVRGEMRAMESRVNAQLSDLARVTEKIHSLIVRLGEASDQQFALVSTKVDSAQQRVEHLAQKMDFFEDKMVSCSQRVDGIAKAGEIGLKAQHDHVSSVAAQLREHLDDRLRDGLDRVIRRGEEAAQAAGAKVASEFDAALRSRCEELENGMTVRDTEQEGQQRRRHDELLRQSAGRRLDELTSQVQRTAERIEVAIESARTTVEAEVQSCVTRVGNKVEALQNITVRQHAEGEAGLQQRLEQALESAVAKGAQGGAQLASQRVEKAVEELDGAIQRHVANAASSGIDSMRAVEKALGAIEGNIALRMDSAVTRASAAGESVVVAQLEMSLQKRLDDAVTRAALQCAQQGAQLVANRTENAVEALGSSQRSELSSAVSGLAERFDDAHAAHLRRLTEREERAARRFEETLEMSSTRQAQKIDEMGSELKRELHGFAKRLNTKIPFM